MNSSQPSAGGGGMMVIIVILVLIVLGVGGYFGYTKLWQPYQCNNKGPDTTSNVATFMWDSKKGKCVANVCIDGFGNAATGGLAVKGVCTQYTSQTVKYKAMSPVGKCTGGTPKTVTTAKSQLDCENACGTDCTGYEYNESMGCDTMTGTLTAPTADTSGYTCYNPTGAPVTSMYQMY